MLLYFQHHLNGTEDDILWTDKDAIKTTEDVADDDHDDDEDYLYYKDDGPDIRLLLNAPDGEDFAGFTDI